ncbi:MAG: M48 family metallopeptidase [Elusimicrobia bacterium]|nr:M48 family metallopeptidase [Elusimicrobiota bacterium]
MAETTTLLGEVRAFLDSLALELPLIFQPGAPTAPRGRGRALKTIPYLGRDAEVLVREAAGAALTELVVEGEALVVVRGEDRRPPQEVLREWLIDRAREALVERADRLAPAMGVTYRGIAVRDQRTLWGSCTREGSLNFNWRLVMAPPGVIDYLVVHELAHRHEMNHSKRFWDHVARHCPEWKAHRKWLRDHARHLAAAVRRS